MKGIDAAFSLAPHAVKLREAGVGFACRYYSYNKAKDLSPAEAKILTAAGILIVSVFEARGDVASNFTPTQGAKDAQAALALAQACGQPEGSTIYFAVDFDASGADLTHNIIPYFKAVGAGLRGHYAVGAYGSGLVLVSLHNGGLISKRWLAQSQGWTGTRNMAGADMIDIEQGPTDHSLLPDAVDTDESAGDDFGGWMVGGAVKPIVIGTLPKGTDDELVAAITKLQTLLAGRGYYKGNIDGIAGPRTNAALIAWENDG